jgi:predicted  nucleic acid-binding Zn-ribbon protein
MEIRSEEDFPKLREQISIWKKRFPMFRHDVNQIENIIEIHIQNYSIALVFHRQTHKKKFLEDAQKEIDSINRVLSTVSKLELIAILSQS